MFKNIYSISLDYLSNRVNRLLFSEIFEVALRFRQLQFVLWNALKHNVLLVGFEKSYQHITLEKEMYSLTIS